MKKRTSSLPAVLVFFLTLLAILPMPVAVAQSDSDSLQFYWAFVAYSNPDVRPPSKAIVIERDTVLYSGDYFRLLVRPVRECYAYVFWYDSRKDLKILFPYTLDQFDKDWSSNELYYIPGGREWFQLDEMKGQEELHLLVSRERLLGLEQLLDSFTAAAGEGKDSLKMKVLNEIRETKRRFRTHKTFAERPTTIAGTVRDPFDIAKYAKEIKGERFYSKTVVIKHK